jgi:hypothetical protein
MRSMAGLYRAGLFPQGAVPISRQWERSGRTKGIRQRADPARSDAVRRYLCLLLALAVWSEVPRWFAPLDNTASDWLYDAALLVPVFLVYGLYRVLSRKLIALAGFPTGQPPVAGDTVQSADGPSGMHDP